MPNNKLYVVNKFLQYRLEIIKYIFSAIALVLVLSLFANALMILLAPYAMWMCIGMGLLLLGALFCCFCYRVFPYLAQQQEYIGKIFYNTRTKELLSIRDYLFSIKMHEYIQGVLAEDTDSARAWRRGSFNTQYITKNFILLNEMADFYLISVVADVLTNFFESAGKQPNLKMKRYKRTELVRLFSGNRCVRLFTKSMAQRKSFDKGYEYGLGKGGKLHEAVTEKGAYYENIEFVLPPKIRLDTDPKRNDILLIIRTPQVEVRISSSLHLGESIYMPQALLYSREVNKFNRVDVNSVDIHVNVDVHFNVWRTLLARKLDDLRWIDRLHRSLERCFDIEYFERELTEKSNHYLFEKLLEVEYKTEAYKPKPLIQPRSYVLR